MRRLRRVFRFQTYIYAIPSNLAYSGTRCLIEECHAVWQAMAQEQKSLSFGTWRGWKLSGSPGSRASTVAGHFVRLRLQAVRRRAAQWTTGLAPVKSFGRPNANNRLIQYGINLQSALRMTLTLAKTRNNAIVVDIIIGIIDLTDIDAPIRMSTMLHHQAILIAQNSKRRHLVNRPAQ